MVDAERLSVGDKVVVSTTASFNGSPKAAWAGKVMTIRSIEFNTWNDRYEIRMVEDRDEADGNGWCWRSHQLDHYDSSECVVIDESCLKVGLEVVLRQSRRCANFTSMIPYYGKTVTIKEVIDDTGCFFIEEDGMENVWHYSHIAKFNPTMDVSQDAFDNFLESVVGKID